MDDGTIGRAAGRLQSLDERPDRVSTTFQRSPTLRDQLRSLWLELHHPALLR